jgi:hypothetical protein
MEARDFDTLELFKLVLGMILVCKMQWMDMIPSGHKIGWLQIKQVKHVWA